MRDRQLSAHRAGLETSPAKRTPVRSRYSRRLKIIAEFPRRMGELPRTPPAERFQARFSSDPFDRPSLFPNILVFGKPLGARRPASARLPRQSASSLSDRLNIRPAESDQLRPFSISNVLMSDKPPSL